MYHLEQHARIGAEGTLLCDELQQRVEPLFQLDDW